MIRAYTDVLASGESPTFTVSALDQYSPFLKIKDAAGITTFSTWHLDHPGLVHLGEAITEYLEANPEAAPVEAGGGA